MRHRRAVIHSRPDMGTCRQATSKHASDSTAASMGKKATRPPPTVLRAVSCRPLCRRHLDHQTHQIERRRSSPWGHPGRGRSELMKPPSRIHARFTYFVEIADATLTLARARLMAHHARGRFPWPSSIDTFWPELAFATSFPFGSNHTWPRRRGSDPVRSEAHIIGGDRAHRRKRGGRYQPRIASCDETGHDVLLVISQSDFIPRPRSPCHEPFEPRPCLRHPRSFKHGPTRGLRSSTLCLILALQAGRPGMGFQCTIVAIDRRAAQWFACAVAIVIRRRRMGRAPPLVFGGTPRSPTSPSGIPSRAV